jgi:hypothetical protein
MGVDMDVRGVYRSKFEFGMSGEENKSTSL